MGGVNLNVTRPEPRKLVAQPRDSLGGVRYNMHLHLGPRALGGDGQTVRGRAVDCDRRDWA